jgi:transcription elongation factor Elf1
LTYFSCDLRFKITISNMLQGNNYSNAVSKYLDLEAGVQDESDESDNSDNEQEKLNRMILLLATARTI